VVGKIIEWLVSLNFPYLFLWQNALHLYLRYSSVAENLKRVYLLSRHAPAVTQNAADYNLISPTYLFHVRRTKTKRARFVVLIGVLRNTQKYLGLGCLSMTMKRLYSLSKRPKKRAKRNYVISQQKVSSKYNLIADCNTNSTKPNITYYELPC